MVALAGVWIWQWLQSRQPLREFWQSGPMIAFCVGLMVIPIGLLLWAALTGGFCEPSQFFMGRCQ
jgi:H+/Cl- antiporter ClcA